MVRQCREGVAFHSHQRGVRSDLLLWPSHGPDLPETDVVGRPDFDAANDHRHSAHGSVAKCGDRHYHSAMRQILLSVFLLVTLGREVQSKDQTDPPYAGTVWIDPDIITPSDPTALVSVTDAGRGERVMYDRRVEAWIMVNAYLFDARYDDGLAIEIQINPEIGNISAAQAEADKHGRVIGQLPTVLRTGVETVWIHKGDDEGGGGNKNILLYTDDAERGLKSGYWEEALVHEAAHTSLDPVHGKAPDWLAAQAADGNFISTYAHDNPEHEDIPESFLSYLAVRYRSARISRSYEGSILETIPNRIAYFDSLLQAQSDDATYPITEDLRPSLDFAHFGNGESISSDLVLVNVETVTAHPAIYFYDQMGEVIDPESVVDVRGNLGVREDGALTDRTGIEPLGERVISTHGRGELVTGSVKVFSDVLKSGPWDDEVGGGGRIGGVLRFDVPSLGVAGVGASAPVNDVIFPARRQEGGINTGAAIRNLGENPIEVSCQLMKDGMVLETKPIPLAGNGQTAKFLHELFTQTDTANFAGSVRCTAPDGERFTGVALELDDRNRIFTTLPVVPIQR